MIGITRPAPAKLPCPLKREPFQKEPGSSSSSSTFVGSRGQKTCVFWYENPVLEPAKEGNGMFIFDMFNSFRVR